MSNKDVTILDLDSMMDMKLNDVETLPDYVNPPTGDYLLRCKKAEIDTYTTKEEPNAKKKRFKVTYAVEETKQLAENSKELPVANGTLFTQTFQATEDGLKYFKKAAIMVTGINDFDTASLKDVMDGMVDQICPARISYRETKAEDGKVYTNMNIRSMRPGAVAE